MIEYAHWRDNFDGTAWWSTHGDVQRIDGEDVTIWDLLAWCPICYGCGLTKPPPDFWRAQRPCPECHGTGRRAFDMEIDWPAANGATIASSNGTFRHMCRVAILHIVPIVPYDLPCEDNLHIVIEPSGIARLHEGLVKSQIVDLPAAATPGMWAVRLKVA